MIRPNILPPTMRDKRRYIAFAIISENKINFNDLSNTIWHCILNYLGELGASKTGAWLIKDSFDEKKQIGLIKCSHDSVEEIRASLALIDRIGDSKVVINVLGISGTIKGARKKFLGIQDLSYYT